MENIFELLKNKQKIDVEVHAEQQHKNGNYPFDIGAVISSNAHIFDGKSSGTGGGHCSVDGIEKRHSAEQQQNSENKIKLNY